MVQNVGGYSKHEQKNKRRKVKHKVRTTLVISKHLPSSPRSSFLTQVEVNQANCTHPRQKVVSIKVLNFLDLANVS